MTQELLFNSGTGTRTHYEGHGIDTRPPPSSRASIGVVFLRFMIRILRSCDARLKSVWRQRISDFLMKARNPEPCIDELIFLCTTEGGPDGLDVAIDILSQTKELILEYAWEFLRRDVTRWTPDSERAYKPNDDYWYILLRAVGRTKADAKARFDFIRCCAGTESRGIREGIVEGLADLATPKAKVMLKKLAKHDCRPGELGLWRPQQLPKL